MGSRRTSAPKSTALGHLQVANDNVILAGDFSYGVNTYVWDVVTDNGATVNTTTAATDFAELSTGTNSTGHAEITTHRAIVGIPGKPIKIDIAAVFDDPTVGNEQLIGFGAPDLTDGFFFGYDAAGDFGIILRHRGTSETIKATDWNRRPGVTPTPQNLSVYEIKIQAMGAGATYFSLEDPQTGGMLYSHIEPHSGLDTVAHSGNFTYSLIASCKNTTSTVNTTLKVQAMAGIISGNLKTTGLDWCARDSAIVTGIGTTLTPIISIRGRTTFNGVTSRMRSILNDAPVAIFGNRTGFAELLINPTLTGASWTDVNTNGSGVEVDTSATAYSAFGRAVHCVILQKESNYEFSANRIIEQLAPGDIWSIGVGFYSGTTGEAAAGFNWREMHG
jgi:hypothetical protein